MPQVHKKLAILMKLTSLIEAAAFTIPLTGKVFRGRRIFTDDDPGTMVSLLEGIPNNTADVVPAGAHGQIRSVTFDILCQGWTADDPNNPTDPIYALMGAVEAQLARVVSTTGPTPTFPDDYLLGKLVSKFIPAAGVARPAENEISSRAFFYIPIRVDMAFDLSNPFISL